MQDGSLDFNTPLTPVETDKVMVARLDAEGVPTAGGYYSITDLATLVAAIIAGT